MDLPAMVKNEVPELNAAEIAAGSPPEQGDATTFLDQLAESARLSDISFTGEDPQSRMFSLLLEDLKALALKRSKLYETLTTLEKVDSDDVSESEDDSEITASGAKHAEEVSKSTFSEENYNESQKSRFYSRLLDIRRKLRHEIATFKKLQPSDDEKSNPSGSSSESVDSEAESYSVVDELPSESTEVDSKETELSNWTTIHRVWCCENHDPIYGGEYSLGYYSRGYKFLTSHKKHSLHPTTTYFLGPPHHRKGSSLSSKLHGEHPIKDIKEYLKARPNLAFVVYKNYDCTTYISQLEGKLDSHYVEKGWFSSDQPKATCVYEEMSIISPKMKEAMPKLAKIFPKDATKHWFDEHGAMQEPYLSLFHYQDLIEKNAEQALEPSEMVYVEYLLDFARNNGQFNQARDMISRGLISREHFSKLFCPGDVLVMNDSPPGSCIINAMPELDLPKFKEGGSWRSTFELKNGSNDCQLIVSRWTYDGTLRLKTEPLACKYESSFRVSRIADLRIHPLQHDNSGIKEILEARAKSFWNFRSKDYISYNGPVSSQSIQGSNSRYMIDYNTLRELHPDADDFSNAQGEEISEEEFGKEHPPEDNRRYVFPSTVSGFSMQDKKWKTLLVDQIVPITWNKLAFKRLVLSETSKELIEALVTVNMTKKHASDMIEGKGDGLLILLHGPPGTGKTLTAESVAELVQKPLYRVTCGDIGTDAEGVEAYLESVLYIGKIWGCVVLLDEADVFLEERSLADLQRNALVSVFLRVLEYYEGILILTSNRVGTFDEAFRSRIKLALHYKALEKPDRRKVWRNFFKIMKEAGQDDIDYEDLDDNLDGLAAHQMNGREIRNALSTAAELAQFRKQALKYDHIKHVISVAGEFEKYLEETHDGLTADELQKEQGVRA